MRTGGTLIRGFFSRDDDFWKAYSAGFAASRPMRDEKQWSFMRLVISGPILFRSVAAARVNFDYLFPLGSGLLNRVEKFSRD